MLVSNENPEPSTSGAGQNSQKLSISATDQLTDEELANMPRVKNLFNQFWEEEINKGENLGDKGNFVKSPLDTTLYAPALAKSPTNLENGGIRNVALRHNQNLNPKSFNQVDNMISDFVDNIRLEQDQRERREEERKQHEQLQEKER